MKTCSIATIPGDGIGQDVIPAGRGVLQAIEPITANPALHTADLGGSATTAQVTQALCRLLG